MSYSLDVNLLLYASDASSPDHEAAREFIESRAADPDLLCLTWLTLMSYLRIATHPAIFSRPLTSAEAWENIETLVRLNRARVLTESSGFAADYLEATKDLTVRGNLVPDAHLATVLRQHGVRRIYSADADFRKFAFLEVVNPLRTK